MRKFKQNHKKTMVAGVLMDGNIIQEIIGMAAGTFTTLSFLPQVIKTYKTRSAKDLSLPMFLLFTLGVSMWMTYGISISKPAIIIANGVTLVLAVMLLVAKFRFKE
jgi:MtN3 and saliva related transmembrane protein